MSDLFTPLTTFVREVPWAVPALGALAAGFAFLVRRWLAGRSAHAVGLPAAPVVPGVRGERRSDLRRKGNAVEVYLTDGDGPPLRAWIKDRSRGGLRLWMDQTLPVNSLWNIRARSAPETSPWVGIEVKFCRPDRGDHEVGCQFLESPPSGVLLYFG